MGTQGIVSIMDGDRVVVKVVAGCSGNEAKPLASLLEGIRPEDATAEYVYGLARDSGLGCRECLVVVDAEAMEYAMDDEPGPLYRETFADPGFNPRWEIGTCGESYVARVRRTA